MSNLYDRIPQSSNERTEHVDAWGFDVLVVPPSFGIIERASAASQGSGDFGMMSEVVADCILDPATRKPLFVNAQAVRKLRTDPNPVIKLGTMALELADLGKDAVTAEKKD